MKSKSLRRLLCVVFCVGLLLALACREKQEGQTPQPRPEQKAAAPPALPPYTVRIVFNGLTAFAEDSGKVWAFLINGEYDPKNPDPDLLPPGILSEVPANSDRADWLAANLPPHYAWIRILNAKITGQNTSPMRSIKGSDLRFHGGLAGPVKADLTQLSNSSHIVKALTSLDLAAEIHKNPPPFDQLDPAFLAPALDRHLAARALIEAGEVVAHPLGECEDRVFSFKPKFFQGRA